MNRRCFKIVIPLWDNFAVVHLGHWNIGSHAIQSLISRGGGFRSPSPLLPLSRVKQTDIFWNKEIEYAKQHIIFSYSCPNFRAFSMACITFSCCQQCSGTTNSGHSGGCQLKIYGGLFGIQKIFADKTLNWTPFYEYFRDTNSFWYIMENTSLRTVQVLFDTIWPYLQIPLPETNTNNILAHWHPPSDVTLNLVGVFVTV